MNDASWEARQNQCMYWGVRADFIAAKVENHRATPCQACNNDRSRSALGRIECNSTECLLPSRGLVWVCQRRLPKHHRNSQRVPSLYEADICSPDRNRRICGQPWCGFARGGRSREGSRDRPSRCPKPTPASSPGQRLGLSWRCWSQWQFHGARPDLRTREIPAP